MTDDVVPSTEPASAVCPGCNRYIGPAVRCPYCHSDAPKPLVLRLLRVGSVVLAVAGLALLYLAVTHRELPVQKIGGITPLMNYAYVRIVGTVPGDAFVGDDNGEVDYVAFSVRDDTGSIRVKARGEVALKLSRSGRLPQGGMHVDVAGSLYVRPDRSPEMRLRAVRQLLVGERSQ
jgi:hypothetical protein